MKPIELRAFAGVRNDLTPERFNSGDLAAAVNVELDETGKPFMRLGTTQLNAVATHSLWADDELAFLVRNGTLHRLNPDMTITDMGVPISGPRVGYERIVNDVYFSDGIVAGVVSAAGYRPWGVVPPSLPALSVVSGAMRPGTYLITMTYVRADGHESGACPVQALEVDANQGVQLTLPVSSDPQVGTKRIYVSDCNGELPYLVSEVSNADTLTTLITELPAGRTLGVRTLRCGPPPGGQIVGYYKGSTFVADNNYLWYSRPYEYELFDRLLGYIGFTSPVRIFCPVSDGLFVGSDDGIVFLQGDSPDALTSRPIANYGSIMGTARKVPEGFRIGEEGVVGDAWMWMTTRGLCLGGSGGEFRNLTGERYTPPEGVSSGASLFKVRGGTPQVVTTLFA